MRVDAMRAAVTVVVLLFPFLSTSGQTTAEVTREKILATGPAWQERYDAYEPQAEMLDVMKTKVGKDLRIVVYLGAWCPDSRNHLPPFIKILDRLGGAVSVRYYDVPRKAGRGIRYYVEDVKVERVPTFIFYRSGEEIGRIVENPNAGLIEDFMEILFR